MSEPNSIETLVQGYTVDGKDALVETILLPFLGAMAHAKEHSNSVALEPTQISFISQFSRFEADFLSGIIAFFSDSPSNFAALEDAKEFDHSRFSLYAPGEVVAMLAYERLIHSISFSPIVKPLGMDLYVMHINYVTYLIEITVLQ